MNIVAQVFGFVALVFYVVSLQINNKTKLLWLLIITNIFYGLQYLMLDAYSASFVSIIGIFRSIVFLKFEREKKDIPIYVLYVIFGLTIYSGILSYNGLISLIPLTLGIIYSWSVWQKNMKKFRIVCMINAISWMFYNFIVGAYVGVVSTIIELVFAVVAFIRFDFKKTMK